MTGRDKLSLEGFNNLTKTLSFNIYDICYARTAGARREYLEHIDAEYNADRLARVLREVAEIIGAQVLNLSGQDYEPMGSSVTVLIAEEPVPQSQVAHLDKSHLAAHTYPETDSGTGISTFRVDIDVSTCGEVSPLTALNHLLRSFESDVVVMDYRVRGFTRDMDGRKHFLDHPILSIQQFIAPEILDRYHTVDGNLCQENLFHTKMMLRDLDTDFDRCLFGSPPLQETRDTVRDLLHREITEIFYGKNIFPPG